MLFVSTFSQLVAWLLMACMDAKSSKQKYSPLNGHSSFWVDQLKQLNCFTLLSSVFLKPQDDSRRISNEEQMKRQELSTKFHNTIKVCHCYFLTNSRQLLEAWTPAKCVYILC